MREATKETVKLGIYFTLIFSAANSFGLMATYIYQRKGLSAAGPLNLISNFASFLISSMIAPKCRWIFKRQMLLGGLGITFNMSTGLVVPFIESQLLSYIYISLGGIAAGFSGGYLWVAQGGYQREIIKNQQDKGKFSGIFQAFYSLANLFAGIVATFFLGYFSEQIYFSVLTMIAICGCLFCLMCFKDIQQESQIHQQSRQAPPTLNLVQTLYKTVTFLPKMWPILLMMVLNGFVISVTYSQMVRIIPQNQDEKQMNRLASILTIFIGLGSMVGSYFGGLICDQLKLLNSGRFTIMYYILAVVMTLLAYQDTFYWFVCLVGFLWGSSYHLFQNWCYVAALKLYDGRLQSFSVNRVMLSFAFIIFEIVVLITNNELNFYLILMTIGSFSIPAWWCLSQQNFENQTSNQKGQIRRTQNLFQDQ